VARRTDRSSANFLFSSTHQWLAGWIALRLTSSNLPPISGLPGSPEGAIIGLLPISFRSSTACTTACRMDRSSAYFLVSSARQWFAGKIARRLTSSFLPLINGLPTACRADRSSAFFLGPSTRQWLARRLAGWIALRLPSSFLPLVSGLPDGLLGGALFGFLPRSLRSSVACLTACRVDRSSATFFVPSARQSLARRLPGWITHRLTSLFLPLVSGFPDSSSDGLLIGLLPCSFRSSVAFPMAPLTDCSSAYFLVLPLINGLPDGSLISLLPRCFCSSMACLTAGRMGRSSAYFLVPSACWQLARWMACNVARGEFSWLCLA